MDPVLGKVLIAVALAAGTVGVAMVLAPSNDSGRTECAELCENGYDYSVDIGTTHCTCHDMGCDPE